MKIVQPITVTDAVLTASGIPEAAPAAWSSGTTYAVGDRVSVVVAGTQFEVYQSLLPTNLNHAPASSPTWWQDVGGTFQAWLVGNTYALNDIVIDPASGIHLAYQSLVASNIGHPLSDATKWLNLGATNRWKMFDQSVQSQTQAPHTIDVTLTVPGRADTIALLNVDGASARATMTDATDGVVFDQSFSLVADSGITDWYAYFFTPIERLTNLVINGLPPYAGATLRVIISDASLVVGAGGAGVLDFSDPSGTELGIVTGVI